MKFPLRLLVAVFGLEVAPAAQVPDFAAADLVLGQTDFTSAITPALPTASSLETPFGVVVDAATGRVFVSDSGHHRVLRYANAAALQNGSAADRVFGQPDPSSHAEPGAPGPATLNAPTGLWMDQGGRLWVADTGHNRVVMYQNAATQSGNAPAASLVLGQPDATSGDPATSQAGMRAPRGLWMDSGGRLWVADSGNNRVLRFNDAANMTTGSPSARATGVLGHAGFADSSAGHDQLGMDSPWAVSVDASGTLWVADRGNNRVTGYPSAATVSDGTNAAHIIGQPDFTTVTPGASGIKFATPSGVFADAAGALWVLDEGNNRVLRYANVGSLNINEPASDVVGQPDFTSAGSGLDARHFHTPALGVFVEANGVLWVADHDNHRVLRFGIVDSGPPTVAITGRRRITTSKRRIVVKGTASDDTGVTRIVLQIANKSFPAEGTTSWKKTLRLKKVRTVVRASAYDAAGKASAPAKLVVFRRPRS